MPEELSYWGVPVDTTWLQTVTGDAMNMVNERAPWVFADAFQKMDPDTLGTIWHYWATSLMALRKVTDPVDEGITPDESDREYLATLTTHLAQGNHHLSADVYNNVVKVCNGRSAEVQQWVYQNHYRRSIEPFWLLAQAIYHLIEGSSTYTKFILQAAMYRLMLARSLQLVKSHEWCADDLGVAADLSALLDDKKMKPPGDDWLSGSK